MTTRKLGRYLVCILMLTATRAALADNAAMPWRWHFGLDYAGSVQYHEPGVQETGTLYGLFLDWDTAPQRRLTVLGNLAVVLSNLKYDGSTQSGIPVKSKTSDHLWMGELALGLHLGAQNKAMVYAGIGSRYWTDIIEDSTTTVGVTALGYRREITYLYAPVGVRLGGTLSERWRVVVDAKYLSLIRGKVQSHLEGVDPNFNTLENTQHSGHGYAVGVRFTHRLEHNSTFTESLIEPYYQAWSVSRSDDATLYYAGVPVGYGWEPQNATRIAGVRLGVAF
jgi:hypothetical protein